MKGAAMEAHSHTSPSDHEYSVDEYLELDAKSDTRWEFGNGRAWPAGNPANLPSAMAGASRAHVQVSRNVLAGLHAQLADTPCEPYGSDLRVQVEETQQFFYPDITVACANMPFVEQKGQDTLQDARVIIEVLSPSTENLDRGGKFASYRKLPSFREYVLIDPRRLHVELYARGDEDWRYTVLEKLEDVLQLDSIGCTLPLTVIYARVEFPAPEP
jgi:Uma2 family endonuclease